MRYCATPSGPKVVEAMVCGELDMIATPAQGNRLPPDVHWVADNGCFGNGYPGDQAWLAWLDSYSLEQRSRCRFAVAPDVVGDAAATLTRSAPFLYEIRQMGYPVAFVAQDGQEHLNLPWTDFDVLFIGGTTGWKLGHAARQLIAEARAWGKWVHMGRVNSERRFAYAHAIGCDSVDGTYLAFGPDTNLPNVAAWIRGLEQTAIGVT